MSFIHICSLFIKNYEDVLISKLSTIFALVKLGMVFIFYLFWIYTSATLRIWGHLMLILQSCCNIVVELETVLSITILTYFLFLFWLSFMILAPFLSNFYFIHNSWFWYISIHILYVELTRTHKSKPTPRLLVRNRTIATNRPLLPSKSVPTFCW